MKRKIIAAALVFSMICSSQVFAGWIQNESGTWSYEQDGVILTDWWFRDNGNLYYVNKDGIMLTGEHIFEDGGYQFFYEDGVWCDPEDEVKEKLTRSYINQEADYIIYYPNDVRMSDLGHELHLDDGSYFICIRDYINPDGINMHELISNQLNSQDSGVTLQHIEQVQINQFNFIKYRCIRNEERGQVLFDQYVYEEDGQVLIVGVTAHLTAEKSVDVILNTLRKKSEP
ncbi:MAG: hypothetical protein ACRDBO_09630 [Lachnospiraceae bacterium]